MEFRNSMDRIIFERLKAFFKSKDKEISRASELKELLGKPCVPGEWYELEDIGLRIPELKRHKAFHYVMAAYVLLVIVMWIVVFLTTLETVFIFLGLPVGVLVGTAFTLTMSPIIGITAIFKRRFLPVHSIDELVDGIITENWTDLLTNDKRLFKDILRQELTKGKMLG
ncbi:hypothetical protein D4L85_27305 [Chryseolinea soli]|uniref:Uncharacterized protein n=2 Tax=Chryseolinea soli TaxID=2321403 RepID=A0A385SS78_9BACT|nr:hypothetical protein D4L85_27305 [Chryseolinea soli]